MTRIAAERARIDDIQRAAVGQLSSERRAALGQFMTPSAVADFMASLFTRWLREVRLLEPGAGMGSLVDAFAAQFFAKAPAGATLSMTCFEIEDVLSTGLSELVGKLEKKARGTGHILRTEVLTRDFIHEASFALSFGGPRFTHVILNPPYKKMSAASDYRLTLRKFGIESVNLYVAFLGLAVALTEAEGEIVAIVPRSFCNGTYFRPFRTWLLERVSIAHVHVFESRKKAFREDDVLQENVIVRLTRDTRRGPVRISSSQDQSLADYQQRTVPHSEVVKPDDVQEFIHVPIKDIEANEKLFAHTLADIGLEVSTGPVVDFRLRDFWLQEPEDNSVPLLYAHHFAGGRIQWPREHKKPNALKFTPETKKWLMPKGSYAIVKRFSAKEEKRRIVAYMLNPNDLPHAYYGFENHLNVIHTKKKGIDPTLARGVAVYLNSTIVDHYFRSFSGHTQVNATDLRQIRFPCKRTLLSFGNWAAQRTVIAQEELDEFVENFHGE